MGVIRALLATCLSLGTAQAASLLCLMDGAMMIVDGNTARFDYFGEGTFSLSSVAPEPGFGAETLYLTTATETVPVLLREQACEKLRATLPVSIEVVVRSASGPYTFSGCCLWRQAG